MTNTPESSSWFFDASASPPCLTNSRTLLTCYGKLLKGAGTITPRSIKAAAKYFLLFEYYFFGVVSPYLHSFLSLVLFSPLTLYLSRTQKFEFYG